LIGVLSLGDLVKETRDPVISASTIRFSHFSKKKKTKTKTKKKTKKIKA